MKVFSVELNRYSAAVHRMDCSGFVERKIFFYRDSSSALRRVKGFVADLAEFFLRDGTLCRKSETFAELLAYVELKALSAVVVMQDGSFRSLSAGDFPEISRLFDFFSHMKEKKRRLADAFGKTSSAGDTQLIRCRQCGRCCRLFDVVVDYSERQRIACFLNLSLSGLSACFRRDLYTWNPFAALIRRRGFFHRRCPFLKKEGKLYICAIHEIRPGVCRAYIPGTALCLSLADREKGPVP